MKLKRLFLSLFSALFVFSLTSCSTENLGIGDLGNQIIPNPWTFLVCLAAFVVMCILVTVLAYKPVKKILKKRHDYVTKNIKDSEQNLIKSEQILEETKQSIKDSKLEAEKIIKDAKEAGNAEKEKIIEQAKLEASNEIKKAQETIAQEIEKSKDDIHKEIVDISMLATSKILEREVNNSDNEKLVNDFIESINEDK